MGLQRCVAGRIYRIRLLPHSRYTNSGIFMLKITSSLVENITSSSMFTIHIQVNTSIHSLQHKVINNSCYYCLAKSSLLTQLSPHYSDEQSSLVINCVFGTLFSLAHWLDRPDGVPMSISRRQSGDIYFLNQSNQGHGTCNEGRNTTYVIAERLCINNQHLFNGNNNNMFCSSMLMQLATSSFVIIIILLML